MGVPPFKQRMAQVFTTLYPLLVPNLDVDKTRENFTAISVQLFTIPTMTPLVLFFFFLYCLS